ncbi:alpha-N-arabinofuranosidase [Pseudoduganella namucuonensis]|uniref:non-reducing end alpha-L-arabinofuranosidase n=1 Tax=Pseudoduganella namucuonensis TaxID=1035707 RepID=A0A1I7LH97_9BURK|nr:alpha-L-arabinofuranosidase C-terminal domain-containing protein [Pseudoduganella namucuonensis]SFV09039.1 alpha-N-arabinofuranosidase [Pseudoduganella namucuonensis]
MKLIKRALCCVGMLAAQAVYAGPEVAVTVDVARPGAVINKNVYGQFAEHLGTGIYGGMWVGPESKTPNIKGWRKDVLDALKDLRVPVVRWPGGCFADEYDWRDGIGPRGKRPVMVNTNWGGVVDNNAVGTHEFFDLIELIGADAYVNGNVGTGSPRETAQWLEYMTGDGQSALARLRARNGRAKPFKVAFFGIGNENWGCGGNMTAAYFTNLYNHHATFAHSHGAQATKLIAGGGLDGDVDWTDYLSRNIRAPASAISLHYYTVPGRGGSGKGPATGFGEDQWISALKDALHMGELLARNVAKLEQNDPQKKFTLAVDEWGTWYEPTPGTPPRFLQQQNSLRDALVAALHFHIFHAHADRVSMANIAQMVNVLQAMILTDGNAMVLTPTYHAFRMHVPFQDAVSLPVKLDNNPQYTLGGAGIPLLSASAARGKDGKLYLSLVNSSPKDAVAVSVALAGAVGKSASGSVLTAAAMDAHNSFASPKAVMPTPFQARADRGKLPITLPPKSVAVVAVHE